MDNKTRVGHLRTVTCLRAQMSAWLHSPRTVLMLIFILAVTFGMAKSFGESIAMRELTAHLGESVYQFLSMGFSMSITSVMFMVMISEVPRQISFQKYLLIRVSRGRWLLSLILFCVVIVLVMILLLTAFSTLLVLPYTTPGNGWSDLARIAADPDAIYGPRLLPEYVEQFTPFSGSLLAGSVLFFYWLTLVLVVLLCALLGKPNLGLLLYFVLIKLATAVMGEYIPGFRAPEFYATILGIASLHPGNETQGVLQSLGIYFLIDLLLIGLMFIVVKHTDLRFSGKE